jgi:poly(3-hydroxybutyrate) depolymerase
MAAMSHSMLEPAARRRLVLPTLWLAFAAAAAAQAAPRTGDFKADFQDPQNKALSMHYRMRAPEKLPEKNHLGLIVCFHGLHSNEDGMTGFAIEAANRTGLADQYVIMGGKSKGEGWAESDDKDVLAWITWAKQAYPIDPRRVHLIGMSNGGGMVKRFGWRHQDLFATVTSYCGVGADFSGVPTGKPSPKAGPQSPAETRTEWYFVHGDADTTVPADTSRKANRDLRNKGYRSIYREIIGADHVGIIKFPEVADDVLRFMHAVRNKELPLSKGAQAELATLAGKAKSVKADGIGEILAAAERIGGPPAGRVILGAFANPDVECRKAAVKSTESTLYGREVVVGLIKLLKDKSDEVKAAAYRGLATAANLRYQEAQETLIQAARGKKTPPAERALAIAGLGQTVKLQFLGSFEDKLAIWTLVLVLDDEDQKAREAAFGQLEKLVKDTFQYKPDMSAKERKESLGKWKGWIASKCGPLEQAGSGK